MLLWFTQIEINKVDLILMLYFEYSVDVVSTTHDHTQRLNLQTWQNIGTWFINYISSN